MDKGRPKRLGRYLIMSQLGKGGMGQVYLAYRLRPDGRAQAVALKVSNTTGTSESIRHEGWILSKIFKPQIEKIFEMGSDEGKDFIAKEYIEGVSLAELIICTKAAEIKLPPDLAAYIASEIACGLTSLHELVDPELGGANQLLHGDLSPQNIMIGFDGKVRLIDLGISRFAKGAFSPSETVEWLNVRYSSPDRILHNRLSIADDIFALGMIAWELFVGENFWSGYTREEIFKNISNFQILDTRLAQVTVSKNVESVVRKCLNTQAFSGYHEVCDAHGEIVEILNSYGASDLNATLKTYMSTLFADRIRVNAEDRSQYLATFEKFKGQLKEKAKAPLAAARAWPKKFNFDFRKIFSTQLQRRTWRALWPFLKPFRFIFAFEAAVLLLALVNVPNLARAWGSSGTWLSIQYVHHLAFNSPLDLIGLEATDSPTKATRMPTSKPGASTYSIKIRATPEAQVILVDNQFTASRGSHELNLTLDQPTLLTLKHSGYSDLNVIVSKDTNQVRADFQNGTVEAK